MKKALSIILSLIMVLSLSVIAFAEEITGDGSSPEQTADSIVKTQTTNERGEDVTSFTVTYPAETTIPWGKTDAVDVAYTINAQLLFNKRLKVSVAKKDGEDAMKGSAGNDATLAYTLDGDVNVTTEKAAVSGLSKAATVTVAQDAWDAAPVDTYQSNLTFTVDVVDA